jgi:hypothetical protein
MSNFWNILIAIGVLFVLFVGLMLWAAARDIKRVEAIFKHTKHNANYKPDDDNGDESKHMIVVPFNPKL